MVSTLVFSLFLSWVQVNSDTYIVKSSAGLDKAKHVLKELETFHQLLGTLAFRNAQLPEIPIEVLLIGDDATMKELAPEYNGRKVPVAGYYQRGDDRDFIVVSGRSDAGPLTNIVYHELSHYFLSRALASRPTWLNEGLADYFATADIRDDEASLGAIPPDRYQVLRTNPLLPLKDLFAVDTSSPYYNESSQAGVFYAEAWAFVHYMMHGEHAARFRQYLEALTKGDANLLRFLNINERELDVSFQNYVKTSIQVTGRKTIKVSPETWSMDTQSIPDTDAEMSIAEIFLANGRLEQARHHLEKLATATPDSSRVSYYRGVLARIEVQSGARELFIDALLDPFLGPRAAVQLVKMGDWHIPAVRNILEEAAAMGTRNPQVYLALATIYTDEIREIQERVRLRQRSSAVADVPKPVIAPVTEAQVAWHKYVDGNAAHVHYEV
ncbi:MAG TPA: DUF1570 domain-containing protein, partial [Terriglobia bacterium]|nr:DUF1570 domain-containing protein [Terriglobia bacterium]